MSKVAIGYCVGEYGLVSNHFTVSLTSFLCYDAKHRNLVSGDSKILFAQGAYIAQNRNNLVEGFLKTDLEWLWWLDYDVTFNPDTLYHLLDAADPVERPIMGGLYFVNLDHGVAPVFFNLKSQPLQRINVGEVVEIGSTGMGCTLIHRSVFEKMQAEYSGNWPWYAHDDFKGRPSGEDITFCRRARKLGFSIWGHCGVFLDHVKMHHLSVASYANSPDVAVLSKEEADG